jgi:molybdopterin converting factor small subunit
MSVKLKLCDAYKPVMPGRPEFVEVEDGTVRDCFKDLITKYPELEKYIYDYPGEMCASLLIFHNGLSISQDELDKPVKDGDEVFPLMIIGGG